MWQHWNHIHYLYGSNYYLRSNFFNQEIIDFLEIEYDDYVHVFLFKSPLQSPNWHTSLINDVHAY